MSELLDQDVAERVLARALANGGRFAEVFAERRRGQSLTIDEQRIESVQSGAEEGAGEDALGDPLVEQLAHPFGFFPATSISRPAATKSSAPLWVSWAWSALRPFG